LLRLDFRDPNPEVIDLSPVGGVVSTLQEGKIECLSGDKVRFLEFVSLSLLIRSDIRTFICITFFFDTPANPLFSYHRSMASDGLCH
jgi:hypothetical protein